MEKRNLPKLTVVSPRTFAGNLRFPFRFWFLLDTQCVCARVCVCPSVRLSKPGGQWLARHDRKDMTTLLNSRRKSWQRVSEGGLFRHVWGPALPQTRDPADKSTVAD